MTRELALVACLALCGISGALAQANDEERACRDDAFNFCQPAIPDRDRVFQCLVQNKDVISAACRVVMGPYLPPEPKPKPKAARKKQTTKASAAASNTKARKAGKKGPINLNPSAQR